MKRAIKKLEDFLNRHDKFIISTHESPDADGLGAEIAFADLLRQLEKEAIICNSDPLPDICKFMDIDNEITTLKDESYLPEKIEQYAHFVLDTNDYDNIGSAYYILKDKIRETFIIDHHEGDQEKIEKNLIKIEASSASEIVYEVFQYFGKDFNFKTAQAIYAGIVFDTGSFRFPKTSTLTFHIASHLLKFGVDPFTVYENLFESNSLSSLQLRNRVSSSMEILCNEQLIAMKLTPEMVQETNGSFSEGEPAINIPFSVKGVRASLLVKQNLTGPVKVSLRSKGNLNVAEIAMRHGGGGHKNAAGFKSALPLEETYELALKEMKRLFM